MTDPIELLQAAVQQTAGIVKGVDADQLGAASPCSDWDVKGVINHTIAAMKMMTAVIDDGSADPSVFSADHVGDDPAGAFEAAGRDVVERFSREGVLESTLNLPFGQFPGQAAISLVTNDIAVHGWDVAKATGQSPGYDDYLADACTAFAKATFTGGFRQGAFADEVEAAPGSSKMDQLAAFLGRQP